MKKYAFSDRKRQNLQRFSEPVITGNNHRHRTKDKVLKMRRRFRIIAPVGAVREIAENRVVVKKAIISHF